MAKKRGSLKSKNPDMYIDVSEKKEIDVQLSQEHIQKIISQYQI